VQLRDNTSSNITTGGDAVSLATNVGSLGGVADNGDGTYTATLTAGTTSGTATITGTVNGAGITDTALVTVNAVPDPTQTLITATPTAIIADGASTSTILVQIKDYSNTNYTSGGDTVTLATDLGSLGSVTDNGNGTYTATLTSGVTSGTATITGTLNAVAITDTEAVTLTGVPDPVTSTITASPTTIIADGASTSTITVQLKDNLSANISAGGSTVTLATDLGSLGSVTDNGDGTYTATLTSAATPGSATITGSLNAVAMTDIETVTFALAPDLQQFAYRWRNDDGGETDDTAFQVTATVDTSTTSTSYTPVAGMTRTFVAGEEGDYLVSFSSTIETSTGSNLTMHAALHVDGSITGYEHTERQINNDSSFPNTPSGVGITTLVTGVTNGTTIDVRYKTSTGTAVMHERTLTFKKIDLADFTQATATADTTTTSASDGLLSGMTITDPGAGDYLVYFSGSTRNSSNAGNNNFFSIYAAGSQVLHSEQRILSEASQGNPNSYPVAIAARVTLASATDDIEIRWRRATTGTATMHERTLVAQRVSASAVSQVSATGDDATSSASDVTVNSMTITDPGAGSYLVSFSSTISGNATTQNVHYYVSLYAGGSKVAHTEREIYNESSWDNGSSNPVMLNAYVTLASATDDFEVRWRSEGGTATMHQRTLVAARLDSAATWVAAEDNVLALLAKTTPKRLRIAFANNAGTSTSVQYRLEVSEPNPPSCDAATDYTRVDTDPDWTMVDSTYRGDGDATSNIPPSVGTDLTDAYVDPPAFVAGQFVDGVGDDQTSGIVLDNQEITEIEYALQATASAKDGAVYCFRLTNAGSTTDFSYAEATYGKVTVDGVDHLLVEASGGGNIASPQEAGTSFNIQITAQDALNNTVLNFDGVGNTADITSDGTLSAGSGTTGTFTGGVLDPHAVTHAVTISNVGDFTITATKTSDTESGTSNTFTVNPGAAAGATSLITAAPTSIVADGATTSTITVQLKDANSNNLTTGGDTVTLATNLGSLGSVTDNSNGTYTATLTSVTTTGTATITGSVNGGNITDNEDVTFTAGPADGATSLITAVPTGIVADGISTSTITVQLKDASSNLLTSGGDTVTLATDLGTLGSVTDNSDGTYTATLTSSLTLGTATITGSVNAAAITDNATVIFAVPDLQQLHYIWRNDDGGEGFDTGNGADGSVTISSSRNINTSILGSNRVGNADGIVSTVASFGSATGGTTLTLASATGFAAGDEVFLVNLQGDATNNGNVGKYEFLKIASIATNTLTFTNTIQNIYGATASNLDLTGQKVVAQRVPHWTSVTINSGGTLAANAWDGSSGGILVFRANGSVNVNAGGIIDANSLGYRGGAGGVADGGQNGESYDAFVGKGGAGTLAGTAGGGAGRFNGSNSSGTRGGGGGGGEDDQGTTEAGGGGGGGGYAGGGGGGGGGADNALSGAGGAGGGTGVAGGGGGCAPGNAVGTDGANAGSSAGNSGVAPSDCIGGAAGSGATTGQGGSSAGFGGGDADSSGGGGGGGGLYGEATLANIFLGSGGGGGGDSDEGASNGADGADGGGIIFIIADSVSNSGTIRSNGGDGLAGGLGSDPFGASGGGSGGSILIQANSFTNSATFTGTGGSGGARDTGTSAGAGGGDGGVGRVRIEADSITGTTSPAASTDVTPVGSVATFAAAQDTLLLALAKDPTLKRLRILISNEAGGAANGTTYRLEVSEPNPATCDAATDYERVDTDPPTA
jgi:adhesin/invasin